MKVLVAGATGVLGTPLIPLLTSSGHEVIALARSSSRAAQMERLGVEIATADLLDRPAVIRAVSQSRPDAIVHLATAIPAAINPRHIAREFGLTNRLRTEGTRNLVDAALRAATRRFIAEGLAYAYDPHGLGLATETTPLWASPPRQYVPVVSALRELEALTGQAGGVVLRFGHVYGPGSIYAPGGSFTRQVQAGKVPLVGGGTSVFSFTHAHDAATAVLAALDRDVTGEINVVDDDPAPMSEWLPVFAEMLGARPPKKIPAAVARMAVGEFGAAFMTSLRGASNSRAKHVLGWRPRYASWRTGLAAGRQQASPAAH